jgi:nicotinate (nicotinamide) nucleotide adenylyltransferase
MPASQKVHAYFGGTFDPPHIGHHQMLLGLLDLPEVERVHVVPTSSNPLKDSVESELFDATVRSALCRAWVSSMGPRVQLEDIELTQPGPSFTQDSIQKIKATSQSRWVLVLGSDQLKGLEMWRGSPDLFVNDFAELWVFSRGEGPLDMNQVPLSLRRASVLIRWLPNIIKNVSSTSLRMALRAHNASREVDLSHFAPGVFEVLPNRS